MSENEPGALILAAGTPRITRIAPRVETGLLLLRRSCVWLADGCCKGRAGAMANRCWTGRIPFEMLILTTNR